jgi:hypothetical protein
MSEWRSIDTAPRDSKAIFWIVPKAPEEQWLMEPGDKPVSTVGFIPHSEMTHYGRWSCLWKATHWMPLPAPPNSGEVNS